jgi:predicted DNA-binding transcriptional regulator AlpA
MPTLDPLLSDHDLELITGRARSCWQKDRLAGTGPRFIRVGRLIRYRRSDVDAWLTARTVNSTSDRPAA